MKLTKEEKEHIANLIEGQLEASKYQIEILDKKSHFMKGAIKQMKLYESILSKLEKE